MSSNTKDRQLIALVGLKESLSSLEVNIDSLLLENEKLRKEIRDREDSITKMREEFLHDSGHDNDTINWALGIVDHFTF